MSLISDRIVCILVLHKRRREEGGYLFIGVRRMLQPSGLTIAKAFMKTFMQDSFRIVGDKILTTASWALIDGRYYLSSVLGTCLAGSKILTCESQYIKFCI